MKINSHNREEIILAYAKDIVEGLDLECLVEIAIEHFQNSLDEYSDCILEDEIQNVSPYLLEDIIEI